MPGETQTNTGGYKRESHQPAVLPGLQDHVTVALGTLPNRNRRFWVHLILLWNFCSFSKILSQGLVQSVKKQAEHPGCLCKEQSGAAVTQSPHTAPLSFSTSTLTQHHASGTGKVWVQHQRSVHVAIPKFNLNCSSWFKSLAGKELLTACQAASHPFPCKCRHTGGRAPGKQCDRIPHSTGTA